MKSPVFLIVPGWTNSGSDHWQTHWERNNPHYIRVNQRDWDDPDPDDWIANLDDAVAGSEGTLVFVAHSLGCIAVARWVETATPAQLSKISGAFLVAPADVDRPTVAAPLRKWRPVPVSKLPFPSRLVASQSDEYLTFTRAQALAAAWSSRLIDAGNAGHINSASGHGPWPEGHRWLVEFVNNL